MNHIHGQASGINAIVGAFATSQAKSPQYLKVHESAKPSTPLQSRKSAAQVQPKQTTFLAHVQSHPMFSSPLRPKQNPLIQQTHTPVVLNKEIKSKQPHHQRQSQISVGQLQHIILKLQANKQKNREFRQESIGIINDARAYARQSIYDIQKQYSNEIAKLLEKNNASVNENLDLKNEIINLHNTIKVMEQNINELQQQIDNQQQQQELQDSGFNRQNNEDDEIDALKEEIAEYEANQEDLMHQIKELNSKLQNEKSLRFEIQSKKEELDKYYTMAYEQVQANAEQERVYLQHISDLQNEIQQHDQGMTMIQQDNEILRSENARLLELIQELQNQQNSYKSLDEDRMNIQFEQKPQNYMLVQDEQLEACPKPELQEPQQIPELQQSDLENQITVLQQQVTYYEAELQEKNKIIKQMQEMLSSLEKDKIPKLTNELEESKIQAKQLNDRLASEIEVLKSKNQQLLIQIEADVTRHEEFSNTNSVQQNEMNQMLIEVQSQLQYFDISASLHLFQQTQTLINSLFTNMSDLSELISDFNYQTIDKYTVEDINQHSRLITKQLQDLSQIIIKLRVAIVQFGVVADNFIEILLPSESLQSGQSKLNQTLNMSIKIRLACALLSEYQTSQTNNQQYNQEYQLTILNYIQQMVENIKSQTEQIEDQGFEFQYTQILSHLEKNVKNRHNITQLVSQLQSIGWKIQENASNNYKALDFMILVSLLQDSKQSLQNIDNYLEVIQAMNLLYSKMSFIPLQYIYSEQDNKVQKTPITFIGLITIRIEINSSFRLFNQINQLFQKILVNKSSLHELYTQLCKKQDPVMPKSHQNKLIIEQDLTLQLKILDLLKNSLQVDDTLQVKVHQPLQYMDGIIELQRSFIEQYKIMVYQSQKLIQNILSISIVQKDDNQENNLLTTLISKLIQAQNKIQAVQEYRAQFLKQNGETLQKFKELFANILEKDQNYLLYFQILNEKLQIKSWNIRMMNEDLFKKIQVPKVDQIIEAVPQDDTTKMNTYEKFKKVILNIEQLISQNLDTSVNNNLKDIIADLLNTIKQCVISEYLLKTLIVKINSFNNTDSKELIQINILSINIIETLSLIKKNEQMNKEHQDNLHQEEKKSSKDSTLLVPDFSENFSQYNENHLQYSHTLKQVIRCKNLEDEIEYKEVISEQFKKTEYLFDLINNNFEQIINCEMISYQVETDQLSQKIEFNESVKLSTVLEKLNIPQSLTLKQVKQCLQQDQNSSIYLEATKQMDSHFWRFRECHLFNVLITQQRLISQYEIQYVQQLIKLKAIETDNRIQKILKSSDFLLQQQNALERHWKQQSNTIQQLISAQLKQLSQLQKQIQSQQPGKERDQLFQDHETLEQQINDQIENVSNIGSSLGITVAFIQDLKKELFIIQDQLKEFNSKMNDMSMDIKFLIGKSPQQLLEIRMEKVLKQKMIDDARSVYVQLYTYEMEDFDKKKESTKRTPLFNSNDEQDGEIDEFITSQKQSSLLVHGPAGSGKSTAAKKVEEHLWSRYKAQQIKNWDESKEPPIIPIFIQLPTLKDPKFRALQETLKSTAYLFNDKQIGDLQKLVQSRKIKLFIIMDSYDELNKYYIEQQLNITNKFEQWCEGANYQILNTTRSEIFTTKSEYRDWFASTTKKISKENFKEIRILPFEQAQRINFYNQYCKLSLKQTMIDIYDILFEQKNTKIDTALIINELWEQISEQILQNNYGNEKNLLNPTQVDQVISLIKSQTTNKIDLYRDQEIHLRSQLSQLWSQKMYIDNIDLLKITHLVETPYMTNIVVSVLPQLIEQFSSQDHLKLVFLRNISTKQSYNKTLTLIELKSNEIWDILIETKSLTDYKVTNNNISWVIVAQILKTVESILANEIHLSEDQQVFNFELKSLISNFLKSEKQEFDYRQLFSLLSSKKNMIQGTTIKQYLQILLDNSQIIQCIEQNQPTSYDFYQMFISEFIKKQINKLAYKQRNFQISKFFEDANEYVQTLGTIMTTNQLTSIEYHQQGIIDKQSEGELQDQIVSLFDDNAKHSNIKAQIRTSIPLKVRGDSYSFFHKSIQEFLFAKSLIDLLDIMKQLQDLKLEDLFVYRRNTYYNNNWNYSEITSYDDYRKNTVKSENKLKNQQVQQLIKYLEYLDKHFINKKIYSEDFFIGSINFIANKIKQNPELLAIILLLLKISKLGSNFQNCTSNCFNIIQRAQIALNKQDLSGIYLKKVSIRDLNLREADLSYSQFNKVDIDGINLSSADMRHCKWQQLITNDLPMLKVKSEVQCLAYSKDSTRLVTGSEDGIIVKRLSLSITLLYQKMLLRIQIRQINISI